MKLLLALLFKGEKQKERRLRNKYLDEGEENPQGMLVSNNCFAVQIKKVLLKPASKGHVENKICHFSMAQLCSLSSLRLTRTTWLKFLGSLSLVIKSHLCQPSDPLHCPLKIWVSSQLPGICCRSPNASDPSLLQPTSSPKHHPAQAGSHSCTSTRHWETLSKGSPLEWHCCIPTLVKDTVKKTEEIEQKIQQCKPKMTKSHLCKQGDKMHFRWLSE